MGGAKALTFGDDFVYVSSKGFDNVIVTHEFSHAKLRSLVKPANILPAWFDEGLAVIVSMDKRYLVFNPDRSMDCLIGMKDGGFLPSSRDDWGDQAEKNHSEMYARAACRVLGILNHYRGKKSIPEIIRSLKDS